MLKKYLSNMVDMYDGNMTLKDVLRKKIFEKYYSTENDTEQLFSIDKEKIKVKMYRDISNLESMDESNKKFNKLYLKYIGLDNSAGTKDYFKSNVNAVKQKLVNNYLTQVDTLEQEYQKVIDDNYNEFKASDKKMSIYRGADKQVISKYDDASDLYYYNGGDYKLGEKIRVKDYPDVENTLKTSGLESSVPENMTIDIRGADYVVIKKGNNWYKAYKIEKGG